MGSKLDDYHRKRDFSATSEPAGTVGDDDQHRFVIQQHSATRLHWDLRLEYDGVLVSWALPRGVPWHPKENHLAVQTEDHPLEYLDFHGDIPEGSYGAGNMKVWDTGTYDIEEWEDRKAVVVLHGNRASGKYALFATRGRDWMIHRMDPAEDPDRRPAPHDLLPMRTTTGTVPSGEGWAFELKHNGVRALLVNEPGLVTISDAAGADITRGFPEVRRIGRTIGAEEVILDGVLLCEGGPDALERRLTAKSDSTVRRIARDQPAAFVAFDLIWHDGHDGRDEPWQRRRERLDGLRLDDEHWRTPAAHVGDGADFIAAARAAGVSELVAKRITSSYRSGVESDDWRTLRMERDT